MNRAAKRFSGRLSAEIQDRVPDPEQHPVSRYLFDISPGSWQSVMRPIREFSLYSSNGERDCWSFTWPDVTRPMVISYRDHRSGQGKSPATVCLELSAINGVVRQCFDLGLIGADAFMSITRRVKRPKASKTRPGRMISADDFRRLLAACRNQQQRCILWLLYGSGIRRSEAIGLTMRRYDVERGTITVIGKGDKARTVQLPLQAHRECLKWIELRGTEPGPFLLPVSKGGAVRAGADHMSTDALYRTIRRLYRNAGIGRVSPHDFRRAYTSTMLEHEDASTVARFLGHSDCGGVSDYDYRSQEPQFRKINRAFEGIA